MKLNCPYCGEKFSYDRSLAGRSVECSYCEQAIKMPTFEELPEESQEELRREEAKRQKKEKRRYLRKQEGYLKEIEKQEKQKVKEKELEKQQELEKKIASAKKPVVEELALKDRYPALRIIVILSKVVAGLVFLAYVGCVVIAAIAAAVYVDAAALPATIAIAVYLFIPTAFLVLLLWASGELILVFLDIADDVRITRLLMKKQVYRETDSPVR